MQNAVDEDRRSGRFILTGSQNLLLMEGICQTLAGRTAALRLLPLTLADYFRTYVERDLRDVLRVLDLDAFERFVRLAAARTGLELNLTGLAVDAGISQPTAQAWITALRIGFIVTLLRPHHVNFRKRTRKRPRLHFLDTGLVCYLLGIHSPALLKHHPLRGSIFESFIIGEIIKGFENDGREAPLFFWRDATGHERKWERVHHTVLPHQSPGYRTLSSSSTTGAKPMEGDKRHRGTEPGHDLDNGRKVLVDYGEMPDPTDDDDLKLAHLYPSADR